ncbi:MAG TPA: homoserine O-succinyltransferase [Candidatus Avamphibacillus sp.]|nr:homoserine O-succinyltransferase [Candidatus Avamphibacillus sp.]
MPINIPQHLPASDLLKEEKIFVMDEDRALMQDIRPLNILILNLMPEKEKTELQLLRLLGNTPLQVNITFLHTATHISKNVSTSHLESFYSTFEDVKEKRFDGMIITGAPIEHLPFEEVNYWDELVRIMEWTKENVTSVMHICWGAQAALYYHYDIGKEAMREKLTGIFEHQVLHQTTKLVRGFEDIFRAPHSRFTKVSLEEVEAHPDLEVLSASDEAGLFLAKSKDDKHVIVTGHLEYDALTLKEEYERDLSKNRETAPFPKHYFPDDNIEKTPPNTWRAHTHLLFYNWLNYYVYQETPFKWK